MKKPEMEKSIPGEKNRCEGPEARKTFSNSVGGWGGVAGKNSANHSEAQPLRWRVAQDEVREAKNKVRSLKNLKSRLRFYIGEFPGSPVVKTRHFHCRGPGFNLWLWN